MIGLGTLINVAGILAGGFLGLLFGRAISERIQETILRACGISVIFIGISGALSGMLALEGGRIASGRTLLVSICLSGGALIGELLNIEGLLERFGSFLNQKFSNGSDNRFIEAFVTASLTVCIGAMAVIGSIEDGVNRNYSILAVKAILDFVIILIMTCSLGKGGLFSAIPVAVFQGGITFGAKLVSGFMTEGALSNLSMIGSIMIFCVGLNLVFEKRIRVANLFPALILAVAASFLPFEL